MNIYLWQLWRRHRFDVVFIHMNMEWTYRLYPAFRLLRLPVLLWYAHGSVTRRLWLAHHCASAIVTSTPEGFRIPSKKLHVIGQGIDTCLFTPQAVRPPQAEIITVSRISARKRIDVLIEALAVLRRLRPEEPFRLRVVGAPLTAADRVYAESLKALARQRAVDDIVDFVGHVPMSDVPAHYRSAFVHVNVSTTGSMDKTVLEALACGCPVLTTNEAFTDLFNSHHEYVLTDDSPTAIALRVLDVYDRRGGADPSGPRSLVDGHHDVESYCRLVVAELRRLAFGASASSPKAVRAC